VLGADAQGARHRLPKDLPRAIRYLEDREVDWLLRAAIHEAKPFQGGATLVPFLTVLAKGPGAAVEAGAACANFAPFRRK
jgi:hypothetical protein